VAEINCSACFSGAADGHEPTKNVIADGSGACGQTTNK
jgi:hypothetical protein